MAKACEVDYLAGSSLAHFVDLEFEKDLNFLGGWILIYLGYVKVTRVTEL